MRGPVRLLELAAFLVLVWLAISALRLMSGEPWPSIMHRPFGFFPQLLLHPGGPEVPGHTRHQLAYYLAVGIVGITHGDRGQFV